jgi:integrative and conjugative element protein (TIGR02256 family)
MLLSCAANKYVLLSDAVLAKISRFVIEPETRLEAGGILIGNQRSPHVEIVDCTTPLPGDRRLPNLFDRCDPGHQNSALTAWQNSGQTESFVGEWHTHPQDFPTPSSIDHKTWEKLLARATDPLVFLVLGRKGFWCGLGYRRTLRILQTIG